MTFSCSSLIFAMGVARSNPNFLPTSRSIEDRKVAKWPLHGTIAPSKMLLDLFGMTSSGSNSVLIPSPLHSLHAPNGELNENVRGSRSPSEILQCGHAFLCEYMKSLPSDETTTVPFPTLTADWIESKSLPFSSAEGVSLSTTASIVCFFCLSRRGYCRFSDSSSSLVSSPSSLILEKPSCFSWSNSFSYVPFFACTTGPRTITLLPPHVFITDSVIESTDWLAIFLPHRGQWGIPILAKSSRR